MQVDLFAQANASFICDSIYSGFGGQPDFVAGALHSAGGHAVVALHSWHDKSDSSAVLPILTNPVTSFQHTAIVSDQGCAELFGRSEHEQARSIIEHVADPGARPAVRRGGRARPAPRPPLILPTLRSGTGRDAALLALSMGLMALPADGGPDDTDPKTKWRRRRVARPVRRGGAMQPVMWFEDLSVGDVDLVGGKGANLGELTGAGLPVPPGFVVTAGAYRDAIEHSGIRSKLVDLLDRMDIDDPSSLKDIAAQAQSLVAGMPVSPELRTAVLDAYHKLGDGTRVAVRSSGTGEDTSGTSFAGMNVTYTNVAGDVELLQRLVDCWASIYGERVIAYRSVEEVTDEPTLAVIVQEMVPSERSGVMFTADPATSATDRIVIEAAFGQGEVVVSGMVEVDTYEVMKEGLRLQSARIGHQSFKIVRGPDGGDLEVPMSAEEGGARVLTDPEVLELARLGLAVERTTAPRRTPSGPWSATPSTSCSRVRCHHAPGRGSSRRRAAPGPAEGAGPGAGRLQGRHLGNGPGVAHPRGRVPPARRGGARGSDDQPRLGTGHPTRLGPGHRRRRHDLPHRHRRPRARGALRGRDPHGHQCAAGRRGGHRRRRDAARSSKERRRPGGWSRPPGPPRTHLSSSGRPRRELATRLYVDLAVAEHTRRRSRPRMSTGSAPSCGRIHGGRRPRRRPPASADPA